MVENMFMFMLIPGTIKGPKQRKYYNWAASYELDDLYENGKNLDSEFPPHLTSPPASLTIGVEGIKVKIFSTSMDTKGREELNGE